jgi:hypothetical protein
MGDWFLKRVRKGAKEGDKREISQEDGIMEMLVLICALYTCLLALMNIVFRL